MFSAQPITSSLLLLTTSLALVACEPPFVALESDVPVVSGPSGLQSQLRHAGFVLDINTMRRTVHVSAPVAPSAMVPLLGALRQSAIGHGSSRLSLLGGDAVEVSLSNYSAGVIGAVVPGKILITLDLTITNRLQRVGLVAPTWPTPPSGSSALLAIPFEIAVITRPGGVTSGGNEVTVSSPRFGVALPSDDWDGAPHSFFSEEPCTETNNDCFRYEPFAPIAPGGTSASRTVGFLVDPTIGELRVRFLVAADVVNGGATGAG